MPYKVANVRRYRPHVTPADRLGMVLEELQVIQTGLERFFGQTALLLPALCGTPLPAQAQPAGRVHRIGFLALGGRPAPPLPSLEAF